VKLVITGDNHHDGNKTPICRTDDFYETQRRKIHFVNGTCEQHNAIHLNCGDIVDRAKGRTATDALSTFFIVSEYNEMYGISGNHDQPNKLLSKVNEGVLGSLMKSDIFHLITDPILLQGNILVYGYNYGEEIKHTSDKYLKDEYIKIALYHGFVTDDENSIIGGLYAPSIVSEFKDDYHFIFTADNHVPFEMESGDCTLINVGSLLRTTISQIDYKPSIILLDTDTLSWERIPVPIVEDVISTEHKDKLEAKRNTMEAVVNTVKTHENVELSFDNEIEYLVTENTKTMNENIENMLNIVMEKEEKYVR